MTEDKIIAHLFNSDSLADVETYRIEETITRYPYFALPRYWLARKQRWQDKLSSNATDTTDRQAIARARLFAHDPFVCLQYLLTPFEQPQIHSALPIAGSLVEEPLPDSSSTETSERESSTPAVESETRSEDLKRRSQSLSPLHQLMPTARPNPISQKQNYAKRNRSTRPGPNRCIRGIILPMPALRSGKMKQTCIDPPQLR